MIGGKLVCTNVIRLGVGLGPIRVMLGVNVPSRCDRDILATDAPNPGT